MICCNQERPVGWNVLHSNETDFAVEPVQRNAGYPAQKAIDHLELELLEKLSGTLRNIHNASAIPIATVMTPAR